MKRKILLSTLIALASGVSGCAADTSQQATNTQVESSKNMTAQKPVSTSQKMIDPSDFEDGPKKPSTKTYKKGNQSEKIVGLQSVYLGDDLQPIIDSGVCEIQVDFGSVGAGIDWTAQTWLIDYIKQNKSVTQAYRQPRGREGEMRYCLSVAKNVNSVRVYQELRAAADEAKKGLVTIKMLIDH